MDEKNEEDYEEPSRRVMAIEYVRGREVKSLCLGYIPDNVVNHMKISVELISSHAKEMMIDVKFSINCLLGGHGLVAEQHKRTAPKTLWIYKVTSIGIPF